MTSHRFRRGGAPSLHFSLLAVVLSIPLGAAPSQAKRDPGDAGAAALSKASPPPAREPERLSRLVSAGGIDERYGAETGVLRRFWRRVPARGAASGEAPLAVARRFLAENASRLGLDAGRLDEDLALLYEKESPSGTHFRWEQVVGGVPVYGADLVVTVSRRGEVSSVYNDLRPGLEVAASPAFDAERAVAIATEAVRPTGAALGEFAARLRVVDLEGGARLSYLVSIPVEKPLGDWLVFVDAATGDVLALLDQARYVNGTGRVFDPDPETKTGNPNLPDNNDSDSGIPFPGAYDTRTLLDITQNGSTYELSGPFAKIIQFESPNVAPYTATHPDSFQLTRSPNGFEDVNAYFQIDGNERYIQSLGFTNVNNRVQEMDVHGLSGADNSHYLPSSKRIAYGDGGVDDAEDADVLLHEYGHSIQDNIVPGWGTTSQAQAMGEGFGDYWGGSYSYSLYPTYQPTYFFNWDGHNEFWSGRLLIDSTLHYPEDCCANIYVGGTLWCSGLWNALLVLGRDVMDRLVLDHHFALGTGATIPDAAYQIIQSDIDLYDGVHTADLLRIFSYWGFLDAGDLTAVSPAREAGRLAFPRVEPNPLSGAGTIVRLSLERETRATIAVFDASGRLVRTLLAGRLAAGPHAVRWDARDARGRAVAPGVYMLHITGDVTPVVTKLVVVR